MSNRSIFERAGNGSAVAPRLGRRRADTGDKKVREAILDAAEERFAKHGYHGVTTREVAARAGVTTAMIHYYFGSKRDLFDEVFARRAAIVNEERLALLDAYEARHGDGVTVEGAIETFLRPVLALLHGGGEGWRNYFGLVALVSTTHEWGGEMMTRTFDPVILRLIAIIRRALPKAREEDLYWGYHFLAGALMLTLSETDRINRLSNGLCRSDDIPAIEPRMIEYAAAGFLRLCGAKA